MAHELSHVLLRHGTANATKAQGFQLGALAGAIAGAVVGGGLGSVISQGSQFGLGTWLLRYSREYEKQADILGAQMMARAGYDPRDLARVFETIEKQGGERQPAVDERSPEPRQPLAVHRAGSCDAAASARRRDNAGDLQRAKRLMASLPPPKSMAHVEREAQRGGRRRRLRRRQHEPSRWARSASRCRRPRRRLRPVKGGKVFQANVPTNW